MDFYQIWYRRSPRGRNQLCQIFWRSVQVYCFSGWLKFAYPHRNWRSPLILSELPFRLWLGSGVHIWSQFYIQICGVYKSMGNDVIEISGGGCKWEINSRTACCLVSHLAETPSDPIKRISVETSRFLVHKFVFKMLQNDWRPELRPGSRWAVIRHSQTSSPPGRAGQLMRALR